MSNQFYQAFVNEYESIFPLQPHTLVFLKHAFKDAKQILDVGCATGAYTHALATNKRSVTGIDMSAAMIHLANKQKTKATVTYKPCDMRTINDHALYDGILSIGNTIVHLENDTAILDFLKRCHTALKENGTLVIQLLNYDRILDQNITKLPMIERPTLTFTRAYTVLKNKVRFETTLRTKNKTLTQSTMLYPIRYKAMLNALKIIGFNPINAYDGFRNECFDSNKSYALVLVAKKT